MKSPPFVWMLAFAFPVLGLSCSKEITKFTNVFPNYALKLDGATTFIEIPSSSAQRPSQITLEVKARFDTVHAGCLPIIAEAYLNQWNRADGFSLKVEENQVHWKLAVTPSLANAFRPPFTPVPHRWYHFACTFDGNVGRIYVDGTLLYEDQRTFAVYYGGSGFWIGLARTSAFGGDVFFRGQIDEVRLWNHARTPVQIAALKNQPLEGNESGLVGYWNFDADAEGVDPAMDRSPSSNGGQAFGRYRLVRSTAFDN